MAGERAHATACRDALAAAGVPTYDFGDPAIAPNVAPANLPKIYALIALEQRYGSPLTMGGSRPVLAWRLSTRAVGRTVNEARWARERLHAALADSRLAHTETPIRFESESAIEPDEGVFSGLTTWTYTARP